MTRRGMVVLTMLAIRTSEEASATEDSRLCELQGTVDVTYYGEEFHGKLMANGERFDMKDPTIAASPTLSLGTRVVLVNPENSTVIHMIIQDRMPKSAPPNALDVSEAAAEKLGIMSVGRAELSVRLD